MSISPVSSQPATLDVTTSTAPPSGSGLLFSRLTDTFLDGIGKDGVITGEELESVAARYRSRTQQQLQTVLKDLGISANATFSLSRDTNGKVVVSGPLPQKDELEAALNDDPQFCRSFSTYASVTSLIAACRRHEEFARAYEQDPVAAVARYRYLFDDTTEWVFGMRYQNGNVSSTVSRA